MAREQRHPPVHVDAQGAVVLALHVQPGAPRTEIAGLHGDAIKVRIAARAVEGRANVALREFLGEAFGVPMARVTLLRGETSRDKLVRIEAPARRSDLGWLRRIGD